MICNQLPIIFIGSHHIDFKSIRSSLFSHCSDYIVGFIIRDFQNWNMISLNDLFNDRNRLTDDFRSFFPLCFVLFKCFMTESRTFRIKSDSNMRRLLTLQNIFQCIDKAKNGRGIYTLRVDPWILDKSVIRTINQCIRIYKE